MSKAFCCDKCELFIAGSPAFKVTWVRVGHDEEWSSREVCEACGHIMHRSKNEQDQRDAAQKVKP